MEKLILSSQPKPTSYLRFGLTIFLILFAGKFVINDALPYFGFDKETFGEFGIISGHSSDIFQINF